MVTLTYRHKYVLINHRLISTIIIHISECFCTFVSAGVPILERE